MLSNSIPAPNPYGQGHGAAPTLPRRAFTDDLSAVSILQSRRISYCTLGRVPGSPSPDFLPLGRPSDPRRESMPQRPDAATNS